MFPGVCFVTENMTMSTTAAPNDIARAAERDSEAQPIRPTFEPSVYVVFTSTGPTLKALEKANELAKPLGAHIYVVAMQAVPYPLPLDMHPNPFEFIIRRFEEAVGQSPGKARIFAYLCRDLLQAFKQILYRDFPVVIGIRKKLWPSRDKRLARKLRRAGYKVILVETE
jgi:hypothetical protein